MRGLARICILISLVLALSLGGSVAQFGSKVVSGDADDGRLLHNFVDLDLGFVDTGGASGTSDDGRVIYLDTSNNGHVDPNDVRLTSYDAYAAGTKVISGDKDNGEVLNDLIGNYAGIYFTHIYGKEGYDFGDPVYIISTNSSSDVRTRTNDVRLNQIGGLSAGTKVLDHDPDYGVVADRMIYPFTVPPGGPIATIRFYNANGNIDDLTGNPIYDYSDDVYLDISLPGSSSFGFVVPNNVRLSVPV